MGYIWGKTNFEKMYPKEFFDAFMMIWVWKSGFNSWNQNFRKCTLSLWSTVSAVMVHIARTKKQKERRWTFLKCLPSPPIHPHTLTPKHPHIHIHAHILIGLLDVSCNDEIFIDEGVEKPLPQLGGDLGMLAAPSNTLMIYCTAHWLSASSQQPSPLWLCYLHDQCS